MKKILIIVLSILPIFFSAFNKLQALDLSDFTPAIDQKVASFKTTEQKVKFLQSFSNLLTHPKFTKDKNARLFEDIREYSLNMLNVFQHELKEEQAKSNKSTSPKTTNTSKSSTKTSSQNKSSIKLPHLPDNFPNIDEQKVRDAILSWHNDERENLGLKDYKYNLDLEGAATVWANEIASSGKTKNLHVRKSGDGTYSYNSILNWFYDLGINFPTNVKGAASFSESVGYGYYKCSKSDCTQSLIDSVKKTRTGLIMKEKSYNGDHYGDHYRAAVMKHFTQMGAGIAIDKSNNRYYIVLHYGVEF